MSGAAEALYHGVPCVCVPMHAEQPINSKALAHQGAGIDVNMRAPVKGPQVAIALGKALLSMLGSDKYRQEALRLGRLTRAHRLSPAERAACEAPWLGGTKCGICALLAACCDMSTVYPGCASRHQLPYARPQPEPSRGTRP